MSELAAKSKRVPSARVPKYLSIAEAVKADIASGILRPNDRLPSFGSMTKQFNVTINTIDKVHSILEQEGIVRREPGRGVFVEPQRKVRTGNIGLLLRKTDENNFYTRSFLNGIQEQVREYDLNIMLVDENDPAIPRKTDGVLLYCRSMDVKTLRLPEDMPRVLILEPATNIEIANVMADDFEGGRLATLHLLELGHRRIGYMPSYVNDPYAIRRLAGYRAALEEYGIAFDDKLCRYMSPLFEGYVMDTHKVMTEWMGGGWRDLGMTAILAPNDEGVFGIVRALNEAGLKVPQDVSIVGFDGIAFPQLGPVQITTIEVPLRDIGVTAVKLLWDQIQKGGHQVTKIAAPVKVRMGTTTSPVA